MAGMRLESGNRGARDVTEVAAPAPGRRRRPERSPAGLLLLSAVVPDIHLAHRCHDPYALREPCPSFSSSLPQRAASPLPRPLPSSPLARSPRPAAAHAPRLHRGLPPFALAAMAARALSRACLPPTPQSLGLAFVPSAAVCSAIAAAAAPDRRTAPWPRRFPPPLRPPTHRLLLRPTSGSLGRRPAVASPRPSPAPGARAASAPLRSRGSSPGSGAYNARVPVRPRWPYDKWATALERLKNK
nr:translation initiation factor IF-2-like [Aegilops tauschii subsp. strangulata]